MEIYINGKRASKKDLLRLTEDIKAGKQAITTKTTKAGNISITTLL